MAKVTPEALIQQFEGFRPDAYWDMNAWRNGFGSDTMTDANGNVVRVTKDSITTRADAQRDLARRIPEFQNNGIIPFVGQKNWDRLSDEAKAAITSVAYNYGSLENLRSLTKAIKAGDTDAMAAALVKYESHNGGINQKRRAAEAAIIKGAPIPPEGMSSDAVAGGAQALGSGKNAPLAKPEPLRLPIDTPSWVSGAKADTAANPALAAARQRLTIARAALGATAGDSSSAAMSVTPKMPSSMVVPQTINTPVAPKWTPGGNTAQTTIPMDQSGVQARATLMDTGVGSLMGSPNLSPSMPNPAPYSPTMPTGGPGTFQVGSNAAQPAAVAEAVPVPLPRDARPAAQPAAAVPAVKQMTTINGKPAEVGSLHKLGEDTFKVVVGPDGKGKMEKIDTGILGEINKPTIAGGMVRQAVGDAIGSTADSVSAAVAPALSSVGAKASELAGNAGSFLTNLFGGGNKPANSTTTTVPKTSALSGGASIEARDEARSSSGGASLTPYSTPAWGASLVPAAKPVASTGLAAPGAGLTAAQKTAMTTVTKYRQVVNPAYEAFMAASGSGVQGLSPDERDEAQRAKLMGGLAATGIAAKPPPQFIQQAYTVQVPVSGGPSLTPSRSVAAPIVQPKIFSSGGYLFADNGKGGRVNIGRDATFANREAGSRGTAAGSSGSYSDRLETTAVQRANYDRQGIAY